jgi:thiamine biosynthesis lipoprotein
MTTGEEGEVGRTVRAEPIMGTVVTVDVRDPVEASLVDAVFAWFRRVDATFSTFREDSEISRLGRGELSEEQCSADVREALGLAAEVERISAGCFAIRIGGRLDPSGLVKGWSVERAARLLTEAGLRNFFVGAGGDVVVRGRPAPRQRWQVGIRHPDVADRMAAVLAVGDPRTGGPPRGLLSMTVVGPSLTYADAFATAAFVMGEHGAAWVGGLPGYEALAITADRRTVWTPGLDRLLVRPRLLAAS